MSLSNCKDKLQAKYPQLSVASFKRIDKETERLKSFYDGLYPELSAADRAAKAEVDAVDNVINDIGRKKYSIYKDVKTRGATGESLAQKSIPKGTDADNLYHNLMGHLSTDQSGRFKGTDIFRKGEAIFRLTTTKMQDVVDALHPELWDSSTTTAAKAKNLRDMRRALHGEVTTPEANKLATSYKETITELQDQFRNAGVDVPVGLENQLPYSYNASKVLKTKKSEFVADVLDNIDKTKMRQFSKKALSDAKFVRLAEQQYDNIITHKKPAFETDLIFKGSAEEEQFLGKYGDPTKAYDGLISHIDKQAKQLAAIETFGRNPKAGFNTFYQQVKDAFAKEGRTTFGKNMTLTDLESIYKVATSTVDGPTSVALAETLNSMTMITRLATFGATVISSLSDTSSVAMRAQLVGMSALKTLGRGVNNLLNPKAFARDAALARRTGYIIDSQLNRSALLDRFDSGDMIGSVADKLRNAQAYLFSVQGLTRWTEAFKLGFYNEFHGVVAKELSLPSDLQHPGFKEIMKIHGITSDEQKLLASGITENAGGKFIDSSKLSFSLQAKYLTAVENELYQAVIEPTAEVIARTTGAAPADTVAGTAARSAFFAMNFPITQFQTHLRTALYHPALDGSMSRTAYVAKSVIMMTSLAMMANSVKKVIMNGEDVPDWSDPKFVLQGAITSGALGPFGDLLFGVDARTASDVIRRLGPVGTIAAGVMSLTKLPTFYEETMNNTNMTLDDKLARFTLGLLPGGNLWFAKLAVDRYIKDNVKRLVDDKAQRAFIDKKRRLKKEQGSRYWWEPGENSPEGTPGIATAPDRFK